MDGELTKHIAKPDILRHRRSTPSTVFSDCFPFHDEHTSGLVMSMHNTMKTAISMRQHFYPNSLGGVSIYHVRFCFRLPVQFARSAADEFIGSTLSTS